MQCPHCSIAFRATWNRQRLKYDNSSDASWICMTTVCPECEKPSIKIVYKTSTGVPVVDTLSEVFGKEQWVFPMSRAGKYFPDEVPEDLKKDYSEAYAVLLISPRSSATLSRRIMESILHQQGYRQKKLVDQIDAVRNESEPDKKLPTALLKMIDAVRVFGNFSAHPITNMKTLQIIDVESGEADVCLSVIEGMFEHYYVRPSVEARNLEVINEKLKEVGRDPL